MLPGLWSTAYWVLAAQAACSNDPKDAQSFDFVEPK
jgi:hypothetical protein